jgi:hypothetical protein
MERVCGVLLVAAGVMFGFVHAVAGDPHSPEGPLQHLALGLPIAAAGVVALVGNATRSPWLVVAGGAAAVPMCIVSILGVPALLIAGLLIAAGARRLGRATPRDLGAAVAIVVLLVGSFFYEVLHQDPAEWATPDGSAGSSNIITTTESLVVLVAVTLAVALAVAYSRTTTPWPAVRAGTVAGPPDARSR